MSQGTHRMNGTAVKDKPEAPKDAPRPREVPTAIFCCEWLMHPTFGFPTMCGGCGTTFTTAGDADS